MRFFWNRAKAQHEVVLIDGNSLPRSSDPQWAPPGLVAVRDPEAARWVRESITTFGASVASFLPGHFEAYARVFHPFDGSESFTWRELAAREGFDLDGPASAEYFAYSGLPQGQPETGRLPVSLMDPLLDHLRPATATSDRCRFAVWDGAQTAISPRVKTVLSLPHREYYLFAGSVDGIHAVYESDAMPRFPGGGTSANLWWPEDRAWFVATEVDAAWTYVGGRRACIDAILADPRLDAEETTAASRW